MAPKGTASLHLRLFDEEAYVVQSDFLLLTFVLVLAVTLLHLSTSPGPMIPMALQLKRSF
jgi:hypothetical protein